jgi:hypothetical protein
MARIDLAKGAFIKKRINDTMEELPKMYFVRGGRYYEYKDKFEVDEFKPFFKKMIMPIPVLKTKDEVDSFLEAEGLRVLGIFYEDDRDDTSDYMQF